MWFFPILWLRVQGFDQQIRVDDLASTPMYTLCTGVLSERYTFEAVDVFITLVTDEAVRKRGFLANYHFTTPDEAGKYCYCNDHHILYYILDTLNVTELWYD